MQKIILNFMKLIVCMFILISTVQAKDKDFVYSVKLGYPGEYPMNYDEVKLLDRNGKPELLFVSGSDGGVSSWGYGSRASSTLASQPLPTSIKIRWFSIMENQFWEAHYTFDQKIFNVLDKYKVTSPFLYKKKNPYTKKKTEFAFMGDSVLIINVVPGGLVTIWISSFGAHEKYLLAQFRAQKTDTNWDKFISRYSGFIPSSKNPSREQYVQKQKMALAQKYKISIKNISSGTSKKWERYMQRYLWKFSISEPFEIKDYAGIYANSEQYIIYADTDQKELGMQAVPIDLDFYAVDTRTNKLIRMRIKLGKSINNGIERENWEDIVTAFEKINKMEPVGGLIDMQLNYRPETNKFSVSLVKAEHKIKVPVVKVALKNLYDFYVPVACPNDDPKLLLTTQDFSTNLDDSAMFVILNRERKPIHDFRYSYRLLREDGKYYYGKINEKGETVRIRTVVGGKTLKVEMYKDLRHSCVPASEIPKDMDIFIQTKKPAKKPFQIYEGARI